MQNRTISVAALVIRNGDTVLTVRKSGTTSFILPGGKPEAGEDPLDTVVREVREELGLHLAAEDLVQLGRFSAGVANEPDHVVVSSVFAFRGLPGDFDPALVSAAAEIAELAWLPFRDLPTDTDERQIAPLTRDHVVPALARALGRQTSDGVLSEPDH